MNTRITLGPLKCAVNITMAIIGYASQKDKVCKRNNRANGVYVLWGYKNLPHSSLGGSQESHFLIIQEEVLKSHIKGRGTHTQSEFGQRNKRKDYVSWLYSPTLIPTQELAAYNHSAVSLPCMPSDLETSVLNRTLLILLFLW